MGEEFSLHVIQFLKFSAHPIHGIDQVAQFAGRSNVQRRSKISLSDLLDVALELAQWPQDGEAGDTGQSDAKDQGQQDQLFGDRFGLS